MPSHLILDCRAVRGVGSWLAGAELQRFPPPRRTLLLHSNAAQVNKQAQVQRYASRPIAGMAWRGMRSTNKTFFQPYPTTAQAIAVNQQQCACLEEGPQ
jgi:hypothetical protein